MKTETDVKPERRSTSSVVVLYEDLAAREHAVQFCDCLVEKFWTSCAFDIDWWAFELLSEPSAASQAREKASQAGWVVVAVAQCGRLALEVKAWIEKWLANRANQQEGTLIGLLPAHLDQADVDETDTYLRNVAHRAGMDYLTKVPHAISHPIPDSLDSYSQRAQCVTGVLDDILHYRCKPPTLDD